MKDTFKNFMEEISLGYGTENGQPVEKRTKILPPVYRRQAFREDYPKGRILVEIKSITLAGVVCECRIYASDTSTEPFANGYGFYPGSDVTAYGAAQTKAERMALTRAGYSYPEENTETEPLTPINTNSAPVVPITEDNLPEMDENGNVIQVPAKKVTKVTPKPEPKTKTEPKTPDSDLQPPAESTPVQAESLPTFPEGKCAGMTIQEVMDKDPTYWEALVGHMKNPEKRERLKTRSPGIYQMLENQI